MVKTRSTTSSRLQHNAQVLLQNIRLVHARSERWESFLRAESSQPGINQPPAADAQTYSLKRTNTQHLEIDEVSPVDQTNGTVGRRPSLITVILLLFK